MEGWFGEPSYAARLGSQVLSQNNICQNHINPLVKMIFTHIKKFSPLTARDHEGRTCLHLAAANDSLPAVTALLKCKVRLLNYFLPDPKQSGELLWGMRRCSCQLMFSFAPTPRLPLCMLHQIRRTLKDFIRICDNLVNDKKKYRHERRQ